MPTQSHTLFVCIYIYIYTYIVCSQQGPLETAPANLGNLCSSESLQTETGIASCTEACAPAKCCQTDLGSANCGFVECASYGECTALASLIGVDVPVTLPEVEEEKEDPFDKIACPDGLTVYTLLPQLNGDNCIVCFAPPIMVAQAECVADCGLETCDFVPADCGVVVCPGTDSPTAAVMESPTAAPTVGDESTTAPTKGVDPTSAAAGGRTVVMVMTTVVGAVSLLWI